MAEKLDDLGLVDVALFVVNVASASRITHEVAELGADFFDGIAIELRPALQLQKAENLIVLNAKDLVFLCGPVAIQAAAGHDVQEPLDRRLFVFLALVALETLL